MKIVNQLSIAGLLLMALLVGCNSDCIQGSGNQVAESRQVADFTKVEVSGSVKLILKQGDIKEVKIIADDNIQKRIRTNVSGSTLEIDRKGNSCDSGQITVYITNKTFEGIAISGAVEVISEGVINSTNLVLALSGSSKVDLVLDAGTVKTESNGSSAINLRGQAGVHDLDISGSSEVNAFDFIVGKYKVSTSGSSKVKINVLNELDVKSSGATDIEYKGSPSSVKEKKSGASSLQKVE